MRFLNVLIQTFLGKAIDPPAIEAVDKAWSILEDLGAVTEEGKLTAMGKHLVRRILLYFRPALTPL